MAFAGYVGFKCKKKIGGRSPGVRVKSLCCGVQSSLTSRADISRVHKGGY